MEYQFRHKLPPDGFYRTESSETQEYMQQYELDEIDEDDAPIIESCCFCCSLSVGILFGALSFLVRKKQRTEYIKGYKLYEIIYIIQAKSYFIILSKPTLLRELRMPYFFT